MNWHSWLKWGAGRSAPLISLILLVSLLVATPAQAQGRIAMSGSFYRQVFEIPQGSSVSAPSIYIVVFNQGQEEFGVKMTWEVPLGVNITLSEEDFNLQAGEQRKILVAVQVTPDAVPGEYTIRIIAESYKQGATGIQVMGAAGQSAKLVVLGESASVRVQTLSPSGEPVVATVRLFKMIGGEAYEIAYSETGTVEAAVSQGSFITSAYVGGQKLAEENFQVEEEEEKTVTLTLETVYFEGFGVVPNYRTETGELAFAEVVYTINNLYQSFPQGEVTLQVSLDGTTLEEVTLATLAPLEKGRLGLKYNYNPAAGWKQGSYGFKLQLHIGGEVYTSTLEESLQVSETPTTSGRQGIWMLIGGVLAGIALLIAIIIILRKRALI